ncbi:MAG: CsgG/HfaB family protein [Desulfobacterales bacterium]
MVAQATLNERLGNQAEALRLYELAVAASPDEPAARAAARSLREKMAWEQDREKRERVEALIEDLTAGGLPEGGSRPADEWTSAPLTVWLPTFKTTGYGLVEGEDVLVHSAVVEELMGRSRARFVERALIDRLLEELKLGSSRLADPATAAALGRLVAAKILLSGQIVHHGSAAEIAVRIIETETGLVRAVVNQSFDPQTAPAEIARLMAVKLADRLLALYPLRGKIATIEKDAIFLNVGRRQGAKVGQLFKAVDADATLEVVSVEEEKCRTKALGGQSAIEPGVKVQVTSPAKGPDG